MYFFTDKNHTITTRSHKFNAEYLDGRLTECDKADPCFVVHHIPNASWGYDVKRIAVITPVHGWSKITTLNATLEQTTPPTYYSLILVNEFWEYIESTDYKDKTDNASILSQDTTTTATVIPNVETIVASETIIPGTGATAQVVQPTSTTTPTTPTTSTTTTPLRSGNGEIIDALNEGVYPYIKTMGEDALYKYEKPNVKNT